MPTHCSPRVPARLLAAAVALLLSSPATAAQQTETSIHGSVVDASDGKPVAGALISLLGTSFSAESNERGGFVFHRVPSATYTLVATRLGYDSISAEVSVRDHAAVEVVVRMSNKPVDLDPLEVTVRSGKLEEVGFYDRRDNSGISAEYITHADLVRRAAARMTDVLVNARGVRVIPMEPGKVTIRFNRRVADQPAPGQRRRYALDGPRNTLDLSGCEPDLYIDGRLYRNASPPMESGGGGARFGEPLNKVDDFNAVPVDAIDAIEVYVGATVPAFVRNTACGVILVWTKR
jgi:hypothetical protein